MTTVHTTSILQEVQDLCTQLAANGEETFFLSVNVGQKQCAYLGSVHGKDFVEKKELVSCFYLHCDSIYSKENKVKSSSSPNFACLQSPTGAMNDQCLSISSKLSTETQSSLPQKQESTLPPQHTQKTVTAKQDKTTRQDTEKSDAQQNHAEDKCLPVIGEIKSENQNGSETTDPQNDQPSGVHGEEKVTVIVDKSKANHNTATFTTKEGKEFSFKIQRQDISEKEVSKKNSNGGSQTPKPHRSLLKQPSSVGLQTKSSDTSSKRKSTFTSDKPISTNEESSCPSHVGKKLKTQVGADHHRRPGTNVIDSTTPKNIGVQRISTRSGGKSKPFAWLKDKNFTTKFHSSKSASDKKKPKQNLNSSDSNSTLRRGKQLEVRKKDLDNKALTLTKATDQQVESTNIEVLESNGTERAMNQLSTGDGQNVIEINEVKESNMRDVCVEVREEDVEINGEGISGEDYSDDIRYLNESSQNSSIGTEKRDSSSDIDFYYSDKGQCIYMIYACRACDQVVKSREKLRHHYIESHNRPFFCDVSRCYCAFSVELDFIDHVKTQHENNASVATSNLDKLLLVAAAAASESTQKQDEDSNKGNDNTGTDDREHEFNGVISDSKGQGGDLRVTDIATEQEIKDGNEAVEISKLNCREEEVSQSAPKSSRGIKTYECAYCGKIFPGMARAKLHMQKYREYKAYQCETCGECFRVKSTLWRHRRVHRDLNGYGCQQCGRDFRTFDGYKSHIITFHSDNISSHWKTFTCRYCKKVFGAKSAYDRHLSVHTGFKPLACNICDKHFSSISGLNTHKKLHERNKKHVCHVCNQSFSIFSKIKRHSQTYKHQQMCAAIGIDPYGNIKHFQEVLEQIGRVRAHPGKVSIPPEGEVLPVTQKDLEQLRTKLILDELEEKEKVTEEKGGDEQIQCVFIHLPEQITNDTGELSNLVYTLGEDGSLLKVE